MLDIGWPELLLVAIVMILVVGPKDLPPMLRAFGKTIKKYRGMATDFKNQFNDALDESELDELRQAASDVKNLNPTSKLKDAMNPFKEAGDDIKASYNEAIKDTPVAPVKAWAPKAEEISEAARSVGKDYKAPVKAVAKKSAAKTAAVKPAAAKAATAKSAAAKKTSAARTAAAKPRAPAVAKTVATAKVPVGKTTTTKAAVAKAPAKKPAATKAASPAQKKPAAAAKKATSTKATASKTPVKKAAAPKADSKG